MGGVSMPEGGGGKKRKHALDATINVVPAIDLLSCCISFLLFTAVWTQVSRLQVAPIGNGPPPEVQPVKRCFAAACAVSFTCSPSSRPSADTRIAWPGSRRLRLLPSSSLKTVSSKAPD